MKLESVKNLGIIAGLLFLGQRGYAEGFQRKLDCHSVDESVVMVLKVDVIDQKTIAIEMEKWSDFFQAQWFRFDGIPAAKARVYFPKSHCIIQENSTKPFICGLGIGSGGLTPIEAHLTSLDGTVHHVTLHPDAKFEVEFVPPSIFDSNDSNIFRAKFNLINEGDIAGVGFRASKCKQN